MVVVRMDGWIRFSNIRNGRGVEDHEVHGFIVESRQKKETWKTWLKKVEQNLKKTEKKQLKKKDERQKLWRDICKWI